MTPVEEMTDEQFEQFTLSVLAKELGPLGMARYLRTFRTGTGDYTRGRHKWLDHLTLDEILDQARTVRIPGSQ